MDKLKDGAVKFEESLASIDLLNKLQEEMGKKIPFTIPKTAIVVTVSLVVFTVMYFTVGPGLLCNILGFAYPAFASFQAIESPDKDDDTQWLTYWVVFSGFSLLETFADALSTYFPMYYAFKFAFLIWLSNPKTRGAQMLYQNGLRQFLLENENEIDRSIGRAQEVVEEITDATKTIANEKAGDIIEEVKGMVKDGFEDAKKD